MLPIALKTLSRAHRPILRLSCRNVGGRRYPPCRQNLHRSAVSYRIPDRSPPTDRKDRKDNEASENERSQQDEAKAESEQATRPKSGTETGNQPNDINEPQAESEKDTRPEPTMESETHTPFQRTTGRSGQGRVRGNRPRQQEGLPPFQVPEWFLERNVKCVEDSDIAALLAVYGHMEVGVKNDTMQMEDKNTAPDLKAEIVRQSTDIAHCGLSPTKSAKYSMHVDVYKEILSTFQAGLNLRPPKSPGSSIPRPITVLQCPKDGGSYYLDSIVETIAAKLNADLICLDAQDIADIIGSYLDENIAWNCTSTAMLGYTAHEVAGKMEEYNRERDPENEDPRAPEDDLFALAGKLKDLMKGDANKSGLASRFWRDKTPPIGVMTLGPNLGDLLSNRRKGDGQLQTSSGDQWNDLKVVAALESLIVAADLKRNYSNNLNGVKSPSDAKDIIVQVRDFKELSGTPEGSDILSKLRDTINKKWQSGRNIICVGTSSAEDIEPALSKPDIQQLQSDISEGSTRTIFVPPDRRGEQDTAFESDEKSRIRRINVRHIEDMISKLSEGTQHLSPNTINIEKDIDSAAVYSAGLEDFVWTHARVHRLAMTILGLENSLSNVEGPLFSKALRIISASDEAKFSWGAKELKEADSDGTATGPREKALEMIKEIAKTCTKYEKKFLGGIVLPSDIQTTFADVRAPEKTIEAVKVLTSLSLIRPDAFKYGVLATDKIPGLLLYGPPGTGKTLLAKAVAKESGAVVLEVTGADLNEMYVGEGEKNVKALFSLAKKLLPCVVFIDEADSVFAQRGSSRRGGHRAMINQFLREWDGLTDMSAFIMIATNRPFDLDEAVLRRIPRRLLVDLPVEKDREAILAIHLKDEILDGSVSLSKIAKDTPFYSGSDLKNVSVAAALACIREENETAAKYTGEEPFVYPEKRILTKAHFDKALEEISASISEDMSSLNAIRKFDEKYGDRKGRRKKATALGFGGTTVVPKDSEPVRVRKIDV